MLSGGLERGGKEHEAGGGSPAECLLNPFSIPPGRLLAVLVTAPDHRLTGRPIVTPSRGKRAGGWCVRCLAGCPDQPSRLAPRVTGLTACHRVLGSNYPSSGEA